MTNPFKKEIEKIHAPKELVERTKARVKDAQRSQRNRIWIQRSSIITAAVVLVGLSSYIYIDSQTSIQVETISKNSMDLDANLGGVGNDLKKEKIIVKEYQDSSDIPGFILAVEPSKVNGIDVYIGKDKKEVYYAYYEKDQWFYFVEARNVSEEEFLSHIKEYVK